MRTANGGGRRDGVEQVVERPVQSAAGQLLEDLGQQARVDRLLEGVALEDLRVFVRVLVGIHHRQDDGVGHPVRHLAVDVERLLPVVVVGERARRPLLALADRPGVNWIANHSADSRRWDSRRSSPEGSGVEPSAGHGLHIVEGVDVVLDQVVALRDGCDRGRRIAR